MVRLPGARKDGATFPNRIAKFHSEFQQTSDTSIWHARVALTPRGRNSSGPTRTPRHHFSMVAERCTLGPNSSARVRQLHEAVLVADHVLEEPPLLAAAITEQGQSVAQSNRRYHQSDLIHQALCQKTLAELRSSHEPDVSATCGSIAGRENLFNQLPEVAGVELNRPSRARQLAACEHDGRSFTIGPTKLERVLVGTRTEHEAVDRSDGVVRTVFRNAFFVDVAGTVHPRNGVVLFGDEAVKARNNMQRHLRSSGVRLSAWHSPSSRPATESRAVHSSGHCRGRTATPPKDAASEKFSLSTGF